MVAAFLRTSMKILPYDTFTVVTPDPLPIVLQRLSENIETTKMFRFSRDHAPYQGTLSEQGFQISRIIHYRNSFLPIIRGRFEPQPNGTAIHLKMSLHPIVMGFLGFWYWTWYGAVIPMTLAGVVPGLMAAAVIGLPIAVLVIFLVAFWTEANRSRNELTQILHGRIGL